MIVSDNLNLFCCVWSITALSTFYTTVSNVSNSGLSTANCSHYNDRCCLFSEWTQYWRDFQSFWRCWRNRNDENANRSWRLHCPFKRSTSSCICSQTVAEGPRRIRHSWASLVLHTTQKHTHTKNHTLSLFHIKNDILFFDLLFCSFENSSLHFLITLWLSWYIVINVLLLRKKKTSTKRWPSSTNFLTLINAFFTTSSNSYKWCWTLNINRKRKWASTTLPWSLVHVFFGVHQINRLWFLNRPSSSKSSSDCWFLASNNIHTSTLLCPPPKWWLIL